MSRIQIAVVGGGVVPDEDLRLAEIVGAELARRGAVLVCGGRNGIMRAAARGAEGAGGVTLGILPTYRWEDANPHLSVVIPTGLGHARNVLVVAAGHAVIAFRGEHGTLSEIGLALKLGRPVIAVRAWRELADVVVVHDPIVAVEAALACAAGSRGSPGRGQS